MTNMKCFISFSRISHLFSIPTFYKLGNFRQTNKLEPFNFHRMRFFFLLLQIFFSSLLSVCNTNNQNAKFTTKNLAHQTHSSIVVLISIYHFHEMQKLFCLCYTFENSEMRIAIRFCCYLK